MQPVLITCGKIRSSFPELGLSRHGFVAKNVDDTGFAKGIKIDFDA
jgi:hypothetical protein